MIHSVLYSVQAPPPPIKLNNWTEPQIKVKPPPNKKFTRRPCVRHKQWMIHNLSYTLPFKLQLAGSILYPKNEIASLEGESGIIVGQHHAAASAVSYTTRSTFHCFVIIIFTEFLALCSYNIIRASIDGPNFYWHVAEAVCTNLVVYGVLQNTE